MLHTLLVMVGAIAGTILILAMAIGLFSFLGMLALIIRARLGDKSALID